MKKIDLDVDFGNVSISCLSNMRATLPIKIDHEELELETAKQLFCGKLLSGMITGADTIDEKQKRLQGMEDARPASIESVFESKRFTCGPATLGASLAFSLHGVDRDALALLEKRSGRFSITMVEEISDGNNGDGEDDGELFTMEDDEHPDVAAGKDRPHGHPMLEAAAKVNLTFENKAWAVSKHGELCELDCDHLAGKKIKALGVSVDGLTQAKVNSLKAALGETIEDVAFALSKNPRAWADAKRWTEKDGEKLVDVMDALYEHVVSESGNTAFK